VPVWIGFRAINRSELAVEGREGKERKGKGRRIAERSKVQVR
jgi:hypothetical protein